MNVFIPFSLYFFTNSYGDNDNNNRTIYIYIETSITKHLTKYTHKLAHQM